MTTSSTDIPNITPTTSETVDTVQPIGNWSIEEAEACYQIDSWGEGYFGVNNEGHMVVQPDGFKSGVEISILEVIEEIKGHNLDLPVVIRFHDILRSRVQKLNNIFKDTIERLGYKGVYRGVYPIKVNQMREVVEEIVDAGQPYAFGLEAGSKPELLSVLAYNTNPDSLTVLNGYKDEDYMRLAMLGRKLNRQIIVVIEQFHELPLLVRIAKEMKVKPLIGLRMKMTAKSTGKWEKSSGDRAKFGLTASELVRVVQYLRKEGMVEQIKLLHFHIGSQVPDIRAFKNAISEAGRIFTELSKMGTHLEYLDLGGGLGVDYDGSRSVCDSSRNYSIQEYVHDIVSSVMRICDSAGIPHPNLVTESGRAITAHHSCVITNVFDVIDNSDTGIDTTELPGESILLQQMRGLLADSLKDAQALFNDAEQLKQELFHAFTLGVVSLEEKAKTETLYWKVCQKIDKMLEGAEYIPDGLEQLAERLSSQYLCNFSVFQSTADAWAIRQLLPVCPIHRLTERPTKKASLVDITCDSDGKIDQFVTEEGISTILPMHELKEEENYYIGIFLTGAYQDVMGDMHNLFGRINEVHIYSYDDDPKDFYIEEIIRGFSAKEVLSQMQYTPQMMATLIKRQIDSEIAGGRILPREGIGLIDFYDGCLEAYTYLRFDDSK